MARNENKDAPSAGEPDSPKADKYYQDLRMLILTGKLSPEEKHTVSKMATRIVPGRKSDTASERRLKTTIQVAINRLQTEDLVNVVPRQGFVIRKADEEEIPRLLFLRVVNECFVAQALIDKLTPLDDEEIAAMVAPLDASIKNMSILVKAKPTGQQELTDLLLADMEFHQLLAKQASFEHAAMVIRRLQNHVLIACPRTTQLDHMNAVLEEHREILEAIKSRQKVEVIEKLRNHIVGGAINALEKRVAQQVIDANTNAWVENLKKSLP